MNPLPNLSVVIPTHNRISALLRTIKSLARQDYPFQQYEVIIVADGCSDNTVSTVQALDTPFALKVLEQNGSGAAGARNFGASHARGRWLVFLDDDIEARPCLLKTHAALHQLKPQQVVMGYLPPRFEGPIDFFRIGLRCWWEELFYQMARPEHRFTYRDLLSGNFSLEADLFRAVGGFDPAFRCREDYELGYRLIKSNAQFTYAAAAEGFHYDASTLERACYRVFAEGRADVAIGHRHPELRAPLLFRMENFVSRTETLFYRLAFDRPRIGNLLASTFNRRLLMLENMRRRQRWREVFNLLRHYWYWRGVAEEIGSRSALANFLQSCPLRADGKEMEIDLRAGLKQAEAELDSCRPDTALLRYGETFIGSIPADVGAEPLRATHLRSILAQRFSKRLLATLALEHATSPETNPVFHRMPLYADQSY